MRLLIFLYLTAALSLAAHAQSEFTAVDIVRICRGITESSQITSKSVTLNTAGGEVSVFVNDGDVDFRFSANESLDFSTATFADYTECVRSLTGANPIGESDRVFYIQATYRLETERYETQTSSENKHYNSSCRSSRARTDNVCFGGPVRNPETVTSYSRCGTTLNGHQINPERPECVLVDVALRSCGRGTFGDCRGHGAITYTVNADVQVEQRENIVSERYGSVNFARVSSAEIALVDIQDNDPIIEIFDGETSIVTLIGEGSATTTNDGFNFKLTRRPNGTWVVTAENISSD